MNFLLSGEYLSMPVPFGMSDWLTFWLILVISVVNGIIMLFVGYKFLQIIQLSGYKLKGYFEWLRATKYKYVGRLVVLSFLSTAALLVTNVLLEQLFIYKILTYLGLAFYFLFCMIFIINMYNAPQKVPLKYTRRMNRLCGVLFVVVMVFSFFMMTASELFIPYLEYGALGLTPVFLPLFVVLAFLITAPLEYLNSKRYVKKAQKKLREQYPNIITIGITGSYGKTSVKNILSTILAEKFKVVSTPYSYNTPLGLSKTILDNMNGEYDIFVAEMGAKYVGDIKFLTEMASPNIGVITGIGNQHLATFGSQENLIATKSELFKYMKTGGKAYVNTDSVLAQELYEKINIEKTSVGVDNDNNKYCVKNVVVGPNGSEFDLLLNGEEVRCSTILLGKHNISNILLSASVAFDLGVSADEIKRAISKLTPPAHRLAIVPSSNSLTIIDDAYNGSVEGARAGLEVISKFEGQKIVITPGLVELGKDEFNANFELGKQMASVATYVIIDGVVNYDALSSGLEFGGFDMEKVLRAGNLTQAVEVLNTISKPGDVVLFENDLPDNYM